MSTELPLAQELAAIPARMAGLLLSEHTVDAALNLLTSLAKETVPGTVGAGITLLDPQGRRTTAAATDERVRAADDLQYELGHGPCLTAWELRTSVRIDDVSHDDRWPQWSSAAVSVGVRSMLSAPMVAGEEALGALKVYADRANAYGDRAESVLSMFAAQAGILLANVRARHVAEQLSERLKDALRARDVIGMAKGVVMQRDGVDEQTAFTLLADTAQREHKPLREVAATLIGTGPRPRR